MSEHACGVSFGSKKLACCICCACEVYEVRAYAVAGPTEGHPARVGPMLEHGTQVSFLMSDGTEADIAFCVDCAKALKPPDYQKMWEAVIDRTDVSMGMGNRSENQRRAALLQYMSIWPVAVLRWRREDRNSPLGLVVDDRRTA